MQARCKPASFSALLCYLICHREECPVEVLAVRRMLLRELVVPTHQMLALPRHEVGVGLVARQLSRLFVVIIIVTIRRFLRQSNALIARLPARVHLLVRMGVLLVDRRPLEALLDLRCRTAFAEPLWRS